MKASELSAKVREFLQQFEEIKPGDASDGDGIAFLFVALDANESAVLHNAGNAEIANHVLATGIEAVSSDIDDSPRITAKGGSC